MLSCGYFLSSVSQAMRTMRVWNLVLFQVLLQPFGNTHRHLLRALQIDIQDDEPPERGKTLSERHVQQLNPNVNVRLPSGYESPSQSNRPPSPWPGARSLRRVYL